MSNRCIYAKRIFTHYFKTLWAQVGMEWDADSDAEIDRAIDEIYAEAVIAAKREMERSNNTRFSV